MYLQKINSYIYSSATKQSLPVSSVYMCALLLALKPFVCLQTKLNERISRLFYTFYSLCSTNMYMYNYMHVCIEMDIFIVLHDCQCVYKLTHH